MSIMNMNKRATQSRQGLALARWWRSLGRLGARVLLNMRLSRLRQELWRIERAEKSCAPAMKRRGEGSAVTCGRAVAEASKPSLDT